MEVGPGFFPEISFFDFLDASPQVLIRQVVKIWEGKIERRDFSFPK